MEKTQLITVTNLELDHQNSELANIDNVRNQIVSRIEYLNGLLQILTQENQVVTDTPAESAPAAETSAEPAQE